MTEKTAKKATSKKKTAKKPEIDTSQFVTKEELRKIAREIEYVYGLGNVAYAIYNAVGRGDG